MADYTYTPPVSVAESSDISVYPASRWIDLGKPLRGAALGSATDTQTVTSGEVTFTGLSSGVLYVVIPDSGEIIDSFMPGEDQLPAELRLYGTGNTLGTVTGYVEVYDAGGTSLGVVAVYDEVTTV